MATYSAKKNVVERALSFLRLALVFLSLQGGDRQQARRACEEKYYPPRRRWNALPELRAKASRRSHNYGQNRGVVSRAQENHEASGAQTRRSSRRAKGDCCEGERKELAGKSSSVEKDIDTGVGRGFAAVVLYLLVVRIWFVYSGLFLEPLGSCLDTVEDQRAKGAEL